MRHELKVALLALALLVFGATAKADIDVGFDFRSTQNYVSGDHSTSCTNTTTANGCEVGISDYPVSFSINGTTISCGWNGTNLTADRNNGVDIRLAGINYVSNATSIPFQCTLPATGDYCIHLALGDNNGVTGFDQKFELFDNNTSLWTVTGTNTDGSYFDANGSQYSAANWPGSESGKTASFATTTFKAYIGGAPTTTDYTTIAHLRIVTGACVGGGGGGGTTYNRGQIL